MHLLITIYLGLLTVCGESSWKATKNAWDSKSLTPGMSETSEMKETDLNRQLTSSTISSTPFPTTAKEISLVTGKPSNKMMTQASLMTTANDVMSTLSQNDDRSVMERTVKLSDKSPEYVEKQDGGQDGTKSNTGFSSKKSPDESNISDVTETTTTQGIQQETRSTVVQTSVRGTGDSMSTSMSYLSKVVDDKKEEEHTKTKPIQHDSKYSEESNGKGTKDSRTRKSSKEDEGKTTKTSNERKEASSSESETIVRETRDPLSIRSPSRDKEKHGKTRTEHQEASSSDSETIVRETRDPLSIRSPSRDKEKHGKTRTEQQEASSSDSETIVRETRDPLSIRSPSRDKEKHGKTRTEQQEASSSDTVRETGDPLSIRPSRDEENHAKTSTDPVTISQAPENKNTDPFSTAHTIRNSTEHLNMQEKTKLSTEEQQTSTKAQDDSDVPTSRITKRYMATSTKGHSMNSTTVKQTPAAPMGRKAMTSRRVLKQTVDSPEKKEKKTKEKRKRKVIKMQPRIQVHHIEAPQPMPMLLSPTGRADGKKKKKVKKSPNRIQGLRGPKGEKGDRGERGPPGPPANVTEDFPEIKLQAAATAVLTDHFGPDKDVIIPFDLKLMDLADNYDNTSGVFMTSIPGIYVISLYLMSHPGAKVNARIFINNRPVAALWADDNKNAGFYPSSSIQTISKLSFGDQVYVMLVDGGYGESWVHANYNAFTLYLLYEEVFF